MPIVPCVDPNTALEPQNQMESRQKFEDQDFGNFKLPNSGSKGLARRLLGCCGTDGAFARLCGADAAAAAGAAAPAAAGARLAGAGARLRLVIAAISSSV